MYKNAPNHPITGQPLHMVIRISDNASIPFDPANTDYQQYLKWLDGYEMVNGQWQKISDGNTPEAAD